MFLSMLQYIFIHAEASNTMDRKNHRVQNHEPKTIGRFAQPNIGSKKKIPGALPPPPSNPPDRPPRYAVGTTKGGLRPPSNPPG